MSKLSLRGGAFLMRSRVRLMTSPPETHWRSAHRSTCQVATLEAAPRATRWIVKAGRLE